MLVPVLIRSADAAPDAMQHARAGHEMVTSSSSRRPTAETLNVVIHPGAMCVVIVVVCP